MVCSIGSGRMAVMARLLAAGSLSQTIGEELGQQKLATQCIYRELHEADEANLLDEEDMHVFGLEPMTDPLDLVCCNACKKPVKTSQYAAHAELCRSLNSTEETTLELDGSVGHRKPPRKERKKLLTAYINQATPVAEQERYVPIDADDRAALESQLDGQPGRSSSFSVDKKRNPACADVAFMVDGKGESPEHTGYSACVMPPPTKRSKLVSSQHLLLSNDPEAASGLTKVMSAQDSLAIRDFQIQSTLCSNMPNECGVVSKFPGKANKKFLTKDIPVPLATKIYYSQRNTRLRLAVARMYHSASAKGINSNVVSPEVSQETIIQLQASSCKGNSLVQVDNSLSKKKEPSACKPDQILAQSSELCLNNSGGCMPATSFSNPLPVNNILRPQTAPLGLLRSKYLSEPYSFTGNSGSLLIYIFL
ncbi:hypothetical protein MANES_03G190800v8 [Manihot esculenta]|uniref:Uncharacterized protein n=2 Tax=Manihot esculenta TaxID=3983 RepID=A0ACB7I4H5_MANES|nr:hypothetical protein MANES_03G190800v8 [Manihot esculenta]KAG8658789.1 hypothetical protein MANES_03G190800v8 [Manihot esculenta]